MKHYVWFALLSSAMLLAQDPPSRVARLNLIQGPVSFQPGTLDEWTAASRNYPLTTGDRLYTDDRSRAELQIGSASLRLDGRTNFSILNLDDRTMQVGITSGSINVRVRSMLGDDVYEVDTPNGAVSLMGRGEYRIDCNPDRNSTLVTVRGGEAELIANGQSFPVRQGETGYFDENTQQLNAAQQPDAFDNFVYARDRREDTAPPSYVSRDMIGWEDLNDNGSWRNVPEYGNVWTPRVAAGWAPYRDGHWAWVAPWGWTWVDDEPWGFAPFHYGRWAYLGDSWGWLPGPVAVRPVYAPALVAFLGGGGLGMSVGFGGGEGVGWFPLGPRDVYMPSYHASRNYVNQVNITNVRNINVTNINYVTNNITDVNTVRNVVYANQQVPGAVTAISRNDFASARPVRQAAMPIPVQALNRAQIFTNATVTPQRGSVLAGPGGGSYAPRPSAEIYTRPLVARVAPPPPPVSFLAAQRVQAPVSGRAPDPAMLRQIQQQMPAARQVYTRPAFTPGAANQARPGQFQQGAPRPFGNQDRLGVVQPVPQGQQPRPGMPQPAPTDQQRMQQMQQQRQMQYPQPRVPQDQAQQQQIQLERQRQIQAEQQRQQQMQQAPNQPRVPQDQAQQQQLQLERQRQIQAEQQRQRQMQQAPNQPRVPQDQAQQQQLQLERQRQIQAEQQRQQQMQQAPRAQPDQEQQRQRQMQAEQQRQFQMERQRQAEQQRQPPPQQQRDAPPRQQPDRRPPPPPRDEKKPPADK